jgi:hypothetical protein
LFLKAAVKLLLCLLWQQKNRFSSKYLFLTEVHGTQRFASFHRLNTALHFGMAHKAVISMMQDLPEDALSEDVEATCKLCHQVSIL